MTNRAAIMAGITIDVVCPGLPEWQRKQVAEILALRCHGNPERTREARLQRLQSLPEADQPAVRDCASRVILARSQGP